MAAMWWNTEVSSSQWLELKNPPASWISSDQVRDEMHYLSMLDTTYFVRIREYVEEAEGTAIIMDPVNGASLRPKPGLRFSSSVGF